ncbi:hypothetical protein AB7179_10510 [Providencia manganoxydans]|uniref:Uncharacterized protein n=1 Tax=Providencia huashanensis TaxID=3037798 RepID=A0ABT9AX29_9GAMM|nr:MULTISPECIES: hypothetical protein [Enterobacterales]ELR5071302.1 hypothetical protein [Providencia rettgeri]ELR5099948.1 hypothetical protein [Providencia rettgeri]ELR5188761.1 hypothetical protein [Providencia rettgeri]MBG5985038.1 hypothetical protein [Proteus vulgaris]MBJ9973523.1 hypothetical protein [Providencia rettgeri]
MAMTVEQLKTRAAAFRLEALRWEDMGYSEQTKRLRDNADALEELAELKEAPPLGYAENGKGFIYPADRADRITNPVPVFAAPPALHIPVGFMLVPKKPTDEQLRAMLAVQWPAIYREHLRHPDNGPKSAKKTEDDIDVATRQYAAAMCASPEADLPTEIKQS